jgi:hypothetical protein
MLICRQPAAWVARINEVMTKQDSSDAGDGSRGFAQENEFLVCGVLLLVGFGGPGGTGAGAYLVAGSPPFGRGAVSSKAD